LKEKRRFKSITDPLGKHKVIQEDYYERVKTNIRGGRKSQSTVKKPNSDLVEPEYLFNHQGPSSPSKEELFTLQKFPKRKI